MTVRLAGREGSLSTAVIAVALAVTTAYPLLRLVLAGFFTPKGVLTWAPLQHVLLRPDTWTVLSNTLFVAVVATAVATLLGVGLAWLTVKSDLPGKTAIRLATLLFLMLPSLIQGLAWVQLWGPVGWFSKLALLVTGRPFVPWHIYGLGGAAVLLGVLGYPFVYLTTSAALGNIPAEMEEVALSCGVGRTRAILGVTLPLVLPAVAAGGGIAFISSLSDFGVPALLALPAGKVVLSTYIFQQMVGYTNTSFSRMALLATLGAWMAAAAIAVQAMLQKRQDSTLQTRGGRALSYPLGYLRLPLAAVVHTVLACTAIAPVVAMILTSLLPAYGVPLSMATVTLKNYLFILHGLNSTGRAIGNSLVLAVGTSTLAVGLAFLVGWGIKERRGRFYVWADTLGAIPYMLPGTVLALAVILAWITPWIPVHVYGTIEMILLAYVARYYLLASRNLSAGFAQLDPCYAEAARVVGVRPWRRLTGVVVPLLRANLQNAVFLVFVAALTEVTVSSLLWISGLETIGVSIYNLEAAGYTTYSTAFSTFIVLLFGVLLVLFGRALMKLQGSALSLQR